MLALPDAFRETRITRLITFLLALSVFAVVAAIVSAGRAVFGA